MDAFWCITLGVLLIRWVWKSRMLRGKPRPAKLTPVTAGAPVDAKAFDESVNAERIAKEKEKQKERDIAELRKQGYSEELITVILPTLHNDGQ